MNKNTNYGITEYIDTIYTITDVIRSKQSVWIGHVHRNAEQRISKQILSNPKAEEDQTGQQKVVERV